MSLTRLAIHTYATHYWAAHAETRDPATVAFDAAYLAVRGATKVRNPRKLAYRLARHAAQYWAAQLKHSEFRELDAD